MPLLSRSHLNLFLYRLLVSVNIFSAIIAQKGVERERVKISLDIPIFFLIDICQTESNFFRPLDQTAL